MRARPRSEFTSPWTTSGRQPCGHSVDVEVTVRSVEGRKVTFDAEIRDAVEVVGRGTHVRMVTDVERFRSMLEAKRERIANVVRQPLLGASDLHVCTKASRGSRGVILRSFAR